jgi:hypothetical protein
VPNSLNLALEDPIRPVDGGLEEALMETRYFVIIHAADARALRGLAGFDLDLFQATARSSEQDFNIQGLVTLDDVGRLVDAGYRVTVEAPEHVRARATQTASLGEWLGAMGEE